MIDRQAASDQLGFDLVERLVLRGENFLLFERVVFARLAVAAIENDVGSGNTLPCVFRCPHDRNNGFNSFVGVGLR